MDVLRMMILGRTFHHTPGDGLFSSPLPPCSSQAASPSSSICFADAAALVEHTYEVLESID